MSDLDRRLIAAELRIQALQKMEEKVGEIWDSVHKNGISSQIKENSLKIDQMLSWRKSVNSFLVALLIAAILGFSGVLWQMMINQAANANVNPVKIEEKQKEGR